MAVADTAAPAPKAKISTKELAAIKGKADKILTRGKLRKPKAMPPPDKEPDPADPMEALEGESTGEGM